MSELPDYEVEARRLEREGNVLLSNFHFTEARAKWRVADAIRTDAAQEATRRPSGEVQSAGYYNPHDYDCDEGW